MDTEFARPSANPAPAVALARVALRSPLAFHLVTWAVILVLPIALVLFLFFRSDADPLLFDPQKHFYLVSVGALSSLAVGVVAVLAGFRLADARLFLIGLAFIGGAGFYTIHGLTTPGFLLHGLYDTAALSEGLGLFWAAALFALAALDLPESIRSWIASRQPWLLLAVALLLMAYGVIGVVGHHLIEAVVLDGNPVFVWTLSSLVLLLMGVAVYRTFQSYLTFQLPVQGALLVGILVLMQAQVALALLPRWHLGWWLYHLFVLLGFLVILYSIAQEYMRGRSLTDTLSEMAPPDAVIQIKRGYHPEVVALAAAAEAKDNYTEGHLQRVAELALRIGREMGLPQARLRTLVQGAFLHDIGKLSTPDAVLLKPGKLIAQEAAVMREHSLAGYRLLMRLKSFDREALVARHHHEWWDGSGYPDRLSGENIPLEARIVAVADVYDALTTDRPYRPALSHQEALAIIENEAGTHLDPTCVQALLRIMGDLQPGLMQGSAKPAVTPGPSPASYY